MNLITLSTYVAECPTSLSAVRNGCCWRRDLTLPCTLPASSAWAAADPIDSCFLRCDGVDVSTGGRAGGDAPAAAAAAPAPAPAPAPPPPPPLPVGDPRGPELPRLDMSVYAPTTRLGAAASSNPKPNPDPDPDPDPDPTCAPSDSDPDASAACLLERSPAAR